MTQENENTVSRVIHRRGVTFMRLWYDGPGLDSIRARLRKVQIKYDPRDLSRVHVWDPTEEQYVEVPAVNQKYIQGLSLVERRSELKRLNEQLRIRAAELQRHLPEFLASLEELMAKEGLAPTIHLKGKGGCTEGNGG